MSGNQQKILVTILILGFSFSAFALVKSMRQPLPVEIKTQGDVLPPRARGNPKADVKIIEFIDFQCPACANGAKVIHDYIDRYPQKIYLELRYFPLAMHAHGKLSAKWGECSSRQNKFWPFFDALIDRQKEWSAMTDPLVTFREIASGAGINNSQIDSCLEDKSVEQAIQTDIDEGKMRGVASTPTYLINHELFVGVKSLKKKLNELLGLPPEVEQTPPSVNHPPETKNAGTNQIFQ